ncbi:MAG: CatB-related O-acetyltransferase [Alphaproteobacteria bacterium]|nr:CatB-related O-acetyltransferase [Alphaproteobacteria bacterium]
MADPSEHIDSAGDWGVTLRYTPLLQKIFNERNIYIHDLPPGSHLSFGSDVVVEPYAYLCHNAVISIRSFSYTPPQMDPGVKVGRYCSIAAGLRVLQHRHPIEWLTTSPFSYHTGDIYNAAYQAFRLGTAPPHDYSQGLAPAPEITNDVWIGQDVLMARNITIGTGAVIAAGSVVTKSVAPYMIVGGNPARVIRPRFAEKLIERLLKSEWWEYDVGIFQHGDYRDPEKFLDAFTKLQEAKVIKPYKPAVTTYSTLINAIMDA